MEDQRMPDIAGGAARLQARQQRLLLVALGCFLGAGVIMMMAFGERLLDVHAHVLGFGFEIASAALGACLAFFILLWARRSGRLDPFEFPVWFSLNAYFQIVVNVWLFQRDQTIRSAWVGNDTDVLAVQAVIMIGCGLVAMWVGYAWGIRKLRHRPRLARKTSGPPRLRLALSIWLITWLIGIVSVLSGIQGYLSDAGGFVGGFYLYFADLLNSAATFGLMLYHFSRPTQLGRWWLIVAVLSNVALGLISGTKTAVFIVLYAIMALYYARGRLPKRWLISGLVVLVLVVPVVNSFRHNLFAYGFDRSHGTTFRDRLPIYAESVQQVLHRPLSSLTGETLETFKTRQRGVFDLTTAVMAVHPHVQPYLGMDMVVLIAQQSIPRFLWADKPASRPEAYNLSTFYLGLPEETSFTAPGQFADVYRTGGWLLVVLWFIFVGVLGAWLYLQGPGRRNLAGTALYLIFLTNILRYDREWLLVVRGVFQIGLIVWISVMYLMFQRLRVESAPKDRGFHCGTVNDWA
jgi:hypothetical protein